MREYIDGFSSSGDLKPAGPAAYHPDPSSRKNSNEWFDRLD